MMSMWSQSAPKRSIRSASDAKLEKSDDSIDGAIFAATAFVIFFLILSLYVQKIWSLLVTQTSRTIDYGWFCYLGLATRGRCEREEEKSKAPKCWWTLHYDVAESWQLLLLVWLLLKEFFTSSPNLLSNFWKFPSILKLENLFFKIYLSILSSKFYYNDIIIKLIT